MHKHMHIHKHMHMDMTASRRAARSEDRCHAHVHICTYAHAHACAQKSGALGGSMRTAIQYTLRPPPVGTANALYRPHTIHRLDKPTSGLLLCAKTKPALLALQRSFAAREVSKRYSAVVSGFVEGEEGEIEHEIDGKHASTRWQVVRRARSLKACVCALNGR